MLSLPAKAQEELLKKIIELDLSVRTTEMMAGKYAGRKPVVKKATKRSAELSDIEKRLVSSLGTRVSLKHNKNGKGRVIIYYFSNEELDSLLEKLT
jgi:ParB family chromosome partitioning protein